MARWRWLPGAKRYYNLDAHRFASFAQVDGWIQGRLAVSETASDVLAEMLAAQELNLPDWQSNLRNAIKSEYISQYLAGRGGVGEMTQADWGRVGGIIGEQYRYLDRFADEIKSGVLSEAQIRARSRMYLRSSREAYERAKLQAFQDAGVDEEAWFLGIAEHCEDCVEFENEGWQELGYFPFPGEGSTICLTNCQCHKLYRVSATGQVFGE